MYTDIPLSQASQLPHLTDLYLIEPGWLDGRHRGQARSHSWNVECQVGLSWLGGRHRWQASAYSGNAGCQVESGWLDGRHRRQARLPQGSDSNY